MGRKKAVAAPIDTGGETPEGEIRATEQAPKGKRDVDAEAGALLKSDRPAALARAKAAGDTALVGAILKVCS